MCSSQGQGSHERRREQLWRLTGLTHSIAGVLICVYTEPMESCGAVLPSFETLANLCRYWPPCWAGRGSSLRNEHGEARNLGRIHPLSVLPH